MIRKYFKSSVFLSLTLTMILGLSDLACAEFKGRKSKSPKNWSQQTHKSKTKTQSLASTSLPHRKVISALITLGLVGGYSK